jgi:hypothetical protein
VCGGIGNGGGTAAVVDGAVADASDVAPADAAAAPPTAAAADPPAATTSAAVEMGAVETAAVVVDVGVAPPLEATGVGGGEGRNGRYPKGCMTIMLGWKSIPGFMPGRNMLGWIGMGANAGRGAAQRRTRGRERGGRNVEGEA